MLVELMAEINRQGGYDEGAGPEPVVGVDLFFDENDDLGSIGCNLSDHPGVDRFHGILRSIEQRSDVAGVWIGISEVMPEGDWPFSDHVYVVTHALGAEVVSWAAELQPEPDFRTDQWWNRVPPAIPIPVPDGYHVIMLWWD